MSHNRLRSDSCAFTEADSVHDLLPIKIACCTARRYCTFPLFPKLCFLSLGMLGLMRIVPLEVTCKA